MRPRQYQREVIDALPAGESALLAMGLGTGKGHPLWEKVLTPEGWTTVGSLREGDYVIGSDGTPTRVLRVFERGVLPVYRVTFTDRSSVVVDGDHLWEVQYAPGKTYVRSTRELMNVRFSDRWIPIVQPVEFEPKEFLLDPYMVGGLLADGHLPETKGVIWTKNEQNVIDAMSLAADRSGLVLEEATCRTSTARRFRFNPKESEGASIRERLRMLGLLGHLSGSKFIPGEYLLGSVDQRRELLAGLMDGDGSVRGGRGYAWYSTKSAQLATDVEQLCWSLGVYARKHFIRSRKGDASKEYWQVTIRGRYNPFKASSWVDKYTGGSESANRTFHSIEPAGMEEVRCLMVEAENSLYVTKDYIVTHNTSTATWLAIKNEAESVLVVAPLRTLDGWERTVRDITGEELRNCHKGNKLGKANLTSLLGGEPGWFFIGWELMRSLNTEKRWDGRLRREVNKSVRHPFNGRTFDVLIADEVHRACNRTSQNFQVLSRVSATVRLGLSATPAGNKPVNIYGALKYLWPDNFTAFTRFADTFFMSSLNPFSTSGMGRLYHNEKRPGTVRSLAPHWFEAEPFTVLDGMPEVNIQRVKARMSGPQKRLYKEWETKALAWLDDNPVAIEMPATLDLRLRQATLGDLTLSDDGVVSYAPDCKSGKIDALLDILADAGDEKVIVYTHSKKFLVPLRHRLERAGYTVAEVSGDDRDGWKTFRDGDAQVLLAVIEAIAEGVDGLQKVCHIEVWMSLSNNLILNEQAKGRLHRSGQELCVTRYLIECEGTIDDTVIGRLGDKFDALKESGLI